MSLPISIEELDDLGYLWMQEMPTCYTLASLQSYIEYYTDVRDSLAASDDPFLSTIYVNTVDALLDRMYSMQEAMVAFNVTYYVDYKGNDTTTSQNDLVMGTEYYSFELDGKLHERGHDVIHGYAGDDVIYGRSGDDQLFGDAGNDVLIAGEGVDHLHGGSGSDTFVISHADAINTIHDFESAIDKIDLSLLLSADDLITVTRNGSMASVSTSAYGRLVDLVGSSSLSLAAIDFVSDAYEIIEVSRTANTTVFKVLAAADVTTVGTDADDTVQAHTLVNYGESLAVDTGDGNDMVRGFWGDDQINTGAGDDYVNGRGGDDVIDGGAGDDTIWGDDWNASGNDVLRGGDGADTVHGAGGDDVIFGDAGNDTLKGGDGNDEIHGGTGNDNIDGGAGNDDLYGDEGEDYIVGAEGDDVAHGGADNDTIWGDYWAYGVGNDELYGDEGNDRLYGVRGDDKLVGGLGADLLSGGEGADTFVFTSVADSNSASYDTIRDFDDLDIIDLTALNTSYANLTFSTRTVSTITTTIVEDATSDFKLQLIGDHSLDETDFAF